MIDTSGLKFILSLVEIPFFIVGFIGNVLGIRIIHKTRQMHTTTNYLLANLALTDLLTMLFLWLTNFIIYQLSHVSDGLGTFICKFSAIMLTLILVSSFTLTLLAVERYHALLKPLRTGMRLNQDNIKQAITAVWVSSVLFCFPSVFLQEVSNTRSMCISVSGEGRKIHTILTFILSTYIPLAIFLFCYGSLLNGLYFSNTICQTDTEEDRTAEKKKLVITFILATAGFLIGYTPIVVYSTVEYDDELGFQHSELDAVFDFIFFCSLCLNPILYAFRSRNFQEGFKRIALCDKSPTQPPQNDIVQLP